MFLVAVGFAAGNVLLSQLVGQHKATRTKTMPYECGKDPVGSAHERFSVKFYLIAMVFILFDIELIFLLPWAVVFRKFIAEGLGALIYVWMKGLFEWGARARVEAEAEVQALHAQDERRRLAARKVPGAAAPRAA